MSGSAAIGTNFSILTNGLNLWYGDFQALKDITVRIKQGIITSLIGPSGCGKTTLLRCFNRLNERYGYVTTNGDIKILDKNIYDPDVCLEQLRKTVGMVFQRPNPLPISVYENVIFGLRVHSTRRNRRELDEKVETAMREVFLWDEFKDKLKMKATLLTLEQQQKLCIARLLPLKPRVILMDEPCSSLDPIATLAIEDLIRSLSKDYAIIIVTHNMQQAARVSDATAFLTVGADRAGFLVEYGNTRELFTNPRDERTEAYITGRFG